MSKIVEIVDSLEFKLKKLFAKIEILEKSTIGLKQDLEKSALVIRKQTEEMEQLKKQYQALKMANSLLGSNENNRDTKLKINSLVREIDYCIAQLSN